MEFRKIAGDICSFFPCGTHTWGCRACPFTGTVDSYEEAERRANVIFRATKDLQAALRRCRAEMKPRG